MNKTKLLALADHMEKVKPKNYDQDSWAEGEVSSRKAEFKKIAEDSYGDDLFVVIPKEGFCGTTACVLGHAPYVKGSGIEFFSSNTYTRGGRRWSDDLDVGIRTGEGPDDIHYGMDAGSIAFDIPRSHAEVLFGSAGSEFTANFYTGKQELLWSAREESFKSVTPQIVAAKLREYVATDGETAERLLQA